ncbi:tetratricopeptide repeat protein [Streptomyces sp. ME02-8801-2C]|uniref:tetratricopeptide repeat protein n=1 Tax=Streptomyces sp. ME02-8801-2C TaxID=3028680 RepID=UPI0029A6407C|nr:tetratricopeptide repeat protein [Streptomyces sp. ME02-8801-2C]MDX3451743.1 tetratricopeptide repeat protein [Streptomyces sp. ME02-8801-2C]
MDAESADFCLGVTGFHVVTDPATGRMTEASWRWVLEADGRVIKEADVRLNGSDWQVDAFRDLQSYLRWRADPSRRLEHESELLDELGRWITRTALEEIGPILADEGPCVVRMKVPPEARFVGGLPWEAAVVGGKPLPLHRVSLVRDLAAASARPLRRKKHPIADALRVLALFSLPDGTSALNLRRERLQLVRLLDTVAKTSGRAIELAVLQYGVTRARLSRLVEDGRGWDVLVLSGHGGEGVFVLEKPDGSRDPIGGDALVELLAPLRRRVKFVLAAACSSADTLTDERLEALGIGPAHRSAESSHEGPQGPERSGTSPHVGTLAEVLADRLDCAVLGMRHTVTDDFVTELNGAVFKLMVEQANTLGRAVALALPRVVDTPATEASPPLAASSPALFGGTAVELLLPPPKGPALIFDRSALKLAGFLDQPARFVGRGALMSAANRCLAEHSGESGIFLQGMAGAGKTACALELSYGQEDNFAALVWHRAPEGTDGAAADIATSLTDFVRALQHRVENLHFAELLDKPEELSAFLPMLTQFCKEERVLVVLDNVESLLSTSGEWRDPRWGLVVDALTRHRGLSRLIMTGRRAPRSLDPGVSVYQVEALSPRESVLLAREMPQLRALLDGELAGLHPSRCKALAVGVLTSAQGHPTLIELAEGELSDPERLAARLAEVDRSWEELGITPRSYLDLGAATRADATAYTAVLAMWTRGVVSALSGSARHLFRVLCWLEPADRRPALLEEIGPLLRETGPGGPEDGDTWWQDWSELAESSLVTVDRDAGGDHVTLVVHPEVAEAGRKTAEHLREVVDRQFATYWTDRAMESLATEREGGSGQVIDAARAALPYLLRRGHWSRAALLLERVLFRDPSPRTAATLLPALRDIGRRAEGSDDELAATRILARVLERSDPDEARTHLERLLEVALIRGDHLAATGLTGDLGWLRFRHGDWEGALVLLDRKPDYTRQAGLGPWSVLGDEAKRLQILQRRDPPETVLGEVERLLDRMDALSAGDLPDGPENVDPWNVREAVLGIGCAAADAMGAWELELTLIDAVLASQQARDAPATDTAHTLFNRYGPLQRLGRGDEAHEVLIRCRALFAREQDWEQVALTTGALADVEAGRGRFDTAVSLMTEALLGLYGAGNAHVQTLRVAHHNLAVFLASLPTRTPEDTRRVLLHGLTSVLLGALVDGVDLGAAIGLIRRLVPVYESPPATVEELGSVMDAEPGIRLADVLARVADPEEVRVTWGAVVEAWTRAGDD